jgi:hypothetical protein
VTDVTVDEAGEPVLSAADEQLLRELTERAKAGALKLTGEGNRIRWLPLCVIRPDRRFSASPVGCGGVSGTSTYRPLLRQGDSLGQTRILNPRLH